MSTATLTRASATAGQADTCAPIAVPGAADVLDSRHSAADHAEPTAPRWWSPLGPYLSYVGYFVGAGLISGGIVHYPLDAARYGRIGAAGAVVFLLATLFQELILKTQTLSPLQLVRVAGASLLLSLGIGMLSGGIQHFTDFPDRGAVLVPAGLVLSFLAHAVRHDSQPARTLRSPGAAVVLVLAVAAFFALQTLAGKVVPAEGGHSHGASPAATAEEDGHGTSSDVEGGAPHGAGTPTEPRRVESDLQEQADLLAELGSRLQELRSPR